MYRKPINEISKYCQFILVYTVGLETFVFSSDSETEVDVLMDNLKKVNLFIKCAKYKQTELHSKGKL